MTANDLTNYDEELQRQREREREEEELREFYEREAKLERLRDEIEERCIELTNIRNNPPRINITYCGDNDIQGLRNSIKQTQEAIASFPELNTEDIEGAIDDAEYALEEEKKALNNALIRVACAFKNSEIANSPEKNDEKKTVAPYTYLPIPRKYKDSAKSFFFMLYTQLRAEIKVYDIDNNPDFQSIVDLTYDINKYKNNRFFENFCVFFLSHYQEVPSLKTWCVVKDIGTYFNIKYAYKAFIRAAQFAILLEDNNQGYKENKHFVYDAINIRKYIDNKIGNEAVNQYVNMCKNLKPVKFDKYFPEATAAYLIRQAWLETQEEFQSSSSQ